MTTRAHVDVVIPVFNGARWLADAIDSIRRQTHGAVTIHVVNDGSTDATDDILVAIAGSEPRLRIHRQSNGGIVSALNHGLSFCTAEFVARHDADDVAHPARLSVQLNYLLSHPDCVAVGAIARHIDADGRPIGTVTEIPPPELADPDWLPAREPYLMHPLLLVRRAALMRVGGYRDVHLAEDSDLYWRLRRLGRLHNLPEVLADYRVHGQSLSSRSLQQGRLMAVGSQLAAVSARRRQKCTDDLRFDASSTLRLRQSAATLSGLVESAAADLSASERPRFELAVAAKLLELASYQPFEPDAADCATMRTALRHATPQRVSRANRRELSAQFTRAAVRLCRAGHTADAMALVPPRWVPQLILRLAVGAALPLRERRLLRGRRTLYGAETP